MHIFVSIWRDGNSILAINVSKWLWLKNGSLWDKGLFSEVVFRIIWELGIDTSRSLLMYCKKRVILKIHWFVRSRKSLWELGSSIIKTTKWEILWLSHPLLFNSYLISSSSINRLQTSVKHFCYHTMHQISLYGTPWEYLKVRRCIDAQIQRRHCLLRREETETNLLAIYNIQIANTKN